MIEKRKVTMVREDGGLTYTQTDYVPLEILDAYLADASTKFASVTVGETHDSGPGGDDGDTYYPPHLIGA